MNEIDKIKNRYNKRKKIDVDLLYSYFNQGNLFIIQELERKILFLLNKHGLNRLKKCKILDVGCGTGGWLLNFIRWGAIPANLHGIDLLKERIIEARQRCPCINFSCADVEKLDFTDNSMDIVTQSTCFTSILDSNLKKAIATEMIRVLRKGGIILWYDFRYNNPQNNDVKAITKKEIKELFPGCSFDFKSVTLAPPLVRPIAPVSRLLCEVLAKIPALKTHYLVVIKKI